MEPSHRRLRVVFLDHTAAPSGAELALLTVLEHLDVDRHVVLGADGPLRARMAAVAGVEVLTMPTHLHQVSRAGAGLLAAPQLLQHAGRLAGRLRALQPDLVYANSLRSGGYGGLAARMAGVPLLWHVRDRVSADYLGANRAVLMGRLIQLLSTHAIANSAATAATLPAGVPVTVMFAPSIPSLNDHEMESILQRATEAGATSAGYVALRLPLEISDLFQQWLATDHPDRAKRVMSLVRQMRGGAAYASEWGTRMTGEGPVAEVMSQRFDVARRRFGLEAPVQLMDVGAFRVPAKAGDQLSLF